MVIIHVRWLTCKLAKSGQAIAGLAGAALYQVEVDCEFYYNQDHV